MAERRLRAADGLLLSAVRASVRELALEPADYAAVRLAEQLAEAVDDADPGDRVAVLRDLGPKLLAVLMELGATPRSRRVGLGGGGDGQQSSLARLRSAHRV